MEIVQHHLRDVFVIQPDITRDGDFYTLSYGITNLQAFGISGSFVQDNISQSAENVLRGLHYQIQHPQGKLIRVHAGRIFDVAIDLLRSSPTFGKSAIVDLKANDNYLLWIPPGYAHGFLVRDGPAIVGYSVTDYRHAEHERTLLWSDPDLMIPWPPFKHSLMLSEKDRQGTPFAQCEYYL